jgi:hypothetical protein
VRRWIYSRQYRDVNAHAAHYVDIWSRYNRDLIVAADHIPQRTLVINIRDLIEQSDAILTHLNTRWGFKLGDNAASRIFQEQRLQRKTTYVDLESPLVRQACDRAKPIYMTLERWREQTTTILNKGT